MVKFLQNSILALSSLISFSHANQNSTATVSGYESYCEQNTLTIRIPYTNAKTAELLAFEAGTCSGSGTSGLIHSYNYNATTQYATFEVKIDECGLDSNTTSHNDTMSFTAVANITLGANDAGKELVFYNALLGAECGETNDYTVTFTYSSSIDTSGGVDCEVNEAGECIVPAYNRYTFGFVEYESDAYVVPVTEDTRETVANEFIYLKLSSADLPSYKKFAIKKCTVQRGDSTYEVFNPAEGVCDNSFIDLSFGYDVSYEDQTLKTHAMIEHRLFLLGQETSEDVYSLQCEIKVCDRSDGSSDCNMWSGCLTEQGEQEDYVCDVEMQASCEAGTKCSLLPSPRSNEGSCELD